MNRRTLLPLLATSASVGLLAALAVLASSPADAQPRRGPVFDGHDGMLSFAAGNHVVDLSDLTMQGTYDPSMYGWAVVYDCTTITVEAGAVVTFLNHPSRAPVIWHATGDVVIDGVVNLNGADGHDGSEPAVRSEPGPGGFRGGRAAPGASTGSSGGFGPGGGFLEPSPTNTSLDGGGGSHGGLGTGGPGGGDPGWTYGGPAVFPLVGGSGGAAATARRVAGSAGGGAGGGALLIASDASLSVSGTLRARGGMSGDGDGPWGSGGGGSGGAIRLVAESLVLADGSTLLATGGGGDVLGGEGRIRLEANGASNLTVDPGAFVSPLPETAIERFEVIPTVEPELQVTRISPDAGMNWIDVELLTADPTATISPGALADVTLDDDGPVRLEIRARNVDPGELVQVWVRHARGYGPHNFAPVESTALVGTFMESFAEADVELAGGVTAIQLRVDFED